VELSISIEAAAKHFESVGIKQVRIVRPTNMGSDSQQAKLCVGLPSALVSVFSASDVILQSLSVRGLSAYAEKWSPPKHVCSKCWAVGHSRAKCVGQFKCPICSGDHEKSACSFLADVTKIHYKCPLCGQAHSGYECASYRGSLGPLVSNEQYQQQRTLRAQVHASSTMSRLDDPAAFPALPRSALPAPASSLVSVSASCAGWSVSNSQVSSKNDVLAILVKQVEQLSALVEKQREQIEKLEKQNESRHSREVQLVQQQVKMLSEKLDKLSPQPVGSPPPSQLRERGRSKMMRLNAPSSSSPVLGASASTAAACSEPSSPRAHASVSHLSFPSSSSASSAAISNNSCDTDMATPLAQ
jgi:hypothetical protein